MRQGAIVNERTIRRTRTASTGLRGVIRAALAAVLLTITSLGVVRTPAARATAVSGPRLAPDAIARRLRLDAWHYALRQRFKPYIWGGVGPRGYDCSGLVWAAYASVGILLPRTTYEMLASRAIFRISRRQARRGDLAFFGREHVELYRYGNWTFGAEHTGTRIGFHKMNRFWHPTMYFRVR
jgi:cell wall-associated NlpC family hydrolase